MSISMYQASVPVFVEGLNVLAHLLRKGEVHARETVMDAAELVQARLAPDMLTLAGQVQRASDTSKLSLQRLTDIPAPKFEDTESSFAELHARIGGTLAYLQNFTEGEVDSTGAKTIQLNLRNFRTSLTGAAYLLSFGLPNFYFHLTTAYDILRHKGVKLGKPDFLPLKP